LRIGPFSSYFQFGIDGHNYVQSFLGNFAFPQRLKPRCFRLAFAARLKPCPFKSSSKSNDKGNGKSSGGGAVSHVPKTGTLGTRVLWGNWRKATAKTKAGPSTHHPRTEKRSGPRSLRMTRLFFCGRTEMGRTDGSAIPGPNTRDLGHPNLWGNWRKATAKTKADPSLTTPGLKNIPTPASKERSPGTPGSGPRSLRMTRLFFVGELRWGERTGVLSQVPKTGTWGTRVLWQERKIASKRC
jgi:hypothetical protein